MIGAALICICISLIIYGLKVLHKKRQYFKRKNVKYIQPNLLLGNSTDAFFGRAHQCEVIDRLYKAYPEEDVVGHFEYLMAAYVVRSPELLEKVFIKDFSYFHDRIMVAGEIESPAQANMFILSGNTWRAIRNKFSPLFTSGKLKYMYNTMSDCGTNLNNALEKKVGQEVEMCDFMQLFTMDVIRSTAFGIEANLLENPDSKFREMAKKIFEGSLLVNLKTALRIFFPKVAKYFGITGFTNEDVTSYFCDVVSNTIQQRRNGGYERNDFVQMLIQLKEKGKIEMKTHEAGDDYLVLDETSGTYELEITDDILIGAAFTFMTAGFHPIAVTLTYALFHLTQAPELMAKVRAEIKEYVIGNEPSYDQLKAMKYLEKVLKETMRMHPIAPVINRICTKEYTFPNGLVVQPGETLFVPVMSIHMDPELWAEPEVFNPDRFQEDVPPRTGTYLAFGDGPRVCIAMRFAMLEMKYGLVKLLANYSFKLSKKTQLPLKIHPRIFLSTPLNGITFQINKLTS